MGVPPLTGRLKTVPSLLAPPPSVVPYKVKPLSIKPPLGDAPLVPLNEARIVGVPPLTGTLKTVPSLYVPPALVVP